MLSRIYNDPNTFMTTVIWSDEMLKRFGQLRGNQYEINGLLSRLFIELKAKQDEAITELGCQFAKAIDQKDREIAELKQQMNGGFTEFLKGFAELETKVNKLEERIQNMKTGIEQRVGSI